MRPDERAFFAAVIRFQALRHDQDRPGTIEYRQLDQYLTEDPVGSLRPQYEQRGYRRHSAGGLEGVLRFSDGDTPVSIEDMSGTGLRLCTPHGAPIGATKGRRTISLTPPSSKLRIDIPVEFVHSEGEAHGVRFAGPPLVLRRHPPTKRTQRVTDPNLPSANDGRYFKSAA